MLLACSYSIFRRLLDALVDHRRERSADRSAPGLGSRSKNAPALSTPVGSHLQAGLALAVCAWILVESAAQHALRDAELRTFIDRYAGAAPTGTRSPTSRSPAAC